MESKSEIDPLIPAQYKPLTLFFWVNTPYEKIKEIIITNNLRYPLIIKPDIGMQGKAVLKVNNGYELKQAANNFTVNFLIQPYVPYPREVGIFYVRYPNDKHGKITGIVEKEFLSVKGDGVNTIEALLLTTPRYKLQIPVLKKLLGRSLNDVLAKGEQRILVPYGNHTRGSLFLDSTHKKTNKIEAVIDKACKSIDGFYFGRLDIRFSSFEDLAEDKNWCIIELNGAGSEPTQMYDPGYSIFFAWKEIILHWKMLYDISMQNRKKGFPFLKFKDGIAMLKENNEYIRKLNKIKLDETMNDSFSNFNYSKPEPQVVE